MPDVASGFKAYSREAAQLVSMSTDFDHTVDHVIQAGRKRMRITSTPVRTHPAARPSRLFSSIPKFIQHTLVKRHGNPKTMHPNRITKR